MKKQWYVVIVSDNDGREVCRENVMASSSEGAAYIFCQKNRDYAQAFSYEYIPDLGFTIMVYMS